MGSHDVCCRLHYGARQASQRIPKLLRMNADCLNLNPSFLGAIGEDIKHLIWKWSNGSCCCCFCWLGFHSLGIFNQDLQISFQPLFRYGSNQSRVHSTVSFYQGQVGNGINSKSFNQGPCCICITVDHDKIDLIGIFFFDLQ